MSQQLIKEAIEALQVKNGGAARVRLEQFAQETGEANMPWLLLAQAHYFESDVAGAMAALERLLAVDTRSLPGLLLMGELKSQSGDDRAASSFYQAALNSAAVSPQVPHQLVRALENAQRFVAEANRRFASHLEASVKASGADASPRVSAALDLLLGRTQLYVQQPKSFYMPGLPQRQFYERDEFDWLEEFEATTGEMQGELAAILADGGGFNPYVETVGERPAPANHLRDDPGWGALYFWQSGKQVAANVSRAPATVRALALAPQPVIAERSPMALYSRLTPGTHIAPHNGLLNTRLICHLPLVAPPGCGLRVGNETREWRAGETLIFDDSIEHEAWNKGSEDRIVLLFEIWRPEVTAEERAALTQLFEAINQYGGLGDDQG